MLPAHTDAIDAISGSPERVTEVCETFKHALKHHEQLSKVQDALQSAFASELDATFRDEDRGLTVEEAARALREFDAILPTLGDAFAAPAFSGGGLRAKILANFGVGVNHIDVAAARTAGAGAPIVATYATSSASDATRVGPRGSRSAAPSSSSASAMMPTWSPETLSMCTSPASA